MRPSSDDEQLRVLGFSYQDGVQARLSEIPLANPDVGRSC
jgi:hypothetical protein